MEMNLQAYAAICRAENAMVSAREFMGATDNRLQAKEFTEIAKCVARARDAEGAVAYLHAVQKASAHVTLDEVWQDGDIQQMAASFIASTAEPDLLSAISRFARTIPKAPGRVLVASGATGDTIAEGFPKIIRRLDLNVGADTRFIKSTAAVVVSAELLSEAGQALFEAELARALIRANNAAIVASILDSNTTSIAAGADPLASLRAGIRAAGPSDGFVVAAPAGDVGWLATHESNRGGMSVRGGTFVPGVEIVAMDDATEMTVIPASRLAYIDGGIKLRPAGHATVDMRDAPEAVGQKVSLWQTNSVGLLVERFWRIDGDVSGVVRVG